MSENLLKARSVFRHGSGAGLAESDSVAEPRSLHYGFIAFLADGEIIALYGAPPQSAIDRHAGRLVGTVQGPYLV